MAATFVLPEKGWCWTDLGAVSALPLCGRQHQQSKGGVKGWEGAAIMTHDREDELISTQGLEREGGEQPDRKRNWRLRLEMSMVSMSMTSMFVNPVSARSLSSSHPSPPAPITNTLMCS